MNKSTKLATACFLAFGLAACESDHDIARKGGLVDQIVDTSLKNCNVVEPANHDTNYETRLRVVLNGAESKLMDVILAKNITVCLDSRLPNQDNGAFDKRIDGIFYNATTPVVTLWDNGMVDAGTEFFTTDTSDYGSLLIDKLASAIEDGDIPNNEDYAFGGRYGCGKNCTTSKWKTKSDFDQDSIAKNPGLLTPPLKLQLER